VPWVEKSDLPSHRGGRRHYRLGSAPPPFPYSGSTLLSRGGKALVVDLRESMGECLGGGVMKSKDLDSEAKSSAMSRQVYAEARRALSRMPTRQAMALASEMQPEWIAFEYALVLSHPMYGLHIPIPWDRIRSARAYRKAFGGDMAMSLSYMQPDGQQKDLALQANPQGIGTLYAIASTVGVPTTMGR